MATISGFDENDRTLNRGDFGRLLAAKSPAIFEGVNEREIFNFAKSGVFALRGIIIARSNHDGNKCAVTRAYCHGRMQQICRVPPRRRSRSPIHFGNNYPRM